MTVLCAGDIHIGRRLSRVDDTYRTAGAWTMIVDLAIEEGVDLVALSGDVVDEVNKSYEALGPLRAGLTRLAEAGIDTVAVAGNHDHDVLPRLAGSVGTERFHLLGRGGEWERWTLERDGQPLLHVDGWSFPEESVTNPPLQQYPVQDAHGVPVMGLLHGDVGVPLSRYAPIQLQDLWSLDMHLMVLGHIHASRQFSGPGGRQALYVGSPWAMDPGEPGSHGVWIAEFDAAGEVTLDHIAIAPVRYESRDVDVSDVENEDDFFRLLSGTLTRIGQYAIAAHGRPYLSTISLRVRFTGTSPAHRVFPEWVDRAAAEIGAFQVDSVQVCPDVFTCEVRPRLDLEELSRGRDPIADVARVILALNADTPDEEHRELVRETLQDMQAIYRKSDYHRLRQGGEDGGMPTEADARDSLTNQAWRMLSMLVDQRQRA